MNWKILVIILIIVIGGIAAYLFLSGKQSLLPTNSGNNVEESIPQPPKLPE